MRYFRSILFAALISVIVSSCSSIPEKLDSFVDNAELKGESYTEDDWNKSTSQYEKLVDEYVNSTKDYSDAEKQMAARAMGRYHALLLKNGIKKSASYLKELGNLLPSYLEGLADEIDESSFDLESTLENLFDEEKIEKSLDKIGSALESLFGTSEE